MSQVSRPDRPVPDIDSEPFWSAAHEGRLLVRRCLDCGRAHHYPRSLCPHCWSERLEWVDASGRARLYTYSTVYRNDLPPFDGQVPYVAAVVELDEGPRLMTRIVDCDDDALTIGMELEVAFEALDDDFSVPVFRPRQGPP